MRQSPCTYYLYGVLGIRMYDQPWGQATDCDGPRITADEERAPTSGAGDQARSRTQGQGPAVLEDAMREGRDATPGRITFRLVRQHRHMGCERV